MNTELLAESPQEKLQNYAEVNNVDLPSGYVNFVPNKQVNPTLDFLNKPAQTVDLRSTLDKKVKTPLILSSPKPKGTGAEAKVSQAESNPFPLTQSNYVSNSPMRIAPSKAAKEAYDYYVQQHKLAPHVAAGIVGNLYQESGLDPLRKQNDGGPGRGIAQWTKDERWADFQKWAAKNSKNPDSLDTQLDYILVEPGQETAIKKTLAAKDVDEATMTFGKLFERPSEAAANWAGRTAMAKHLQNFSI